MSAPEVTVGSRWVSHAGGDFTVLAVDGDVVGIRWHDGARAWVPLHWFAQGTYTPAPPPKPTPPTPRERWLAISPHGSECTWPTEGAARESASVMGGAWVAPLVPDMDAAEWVRP